MSILPRDNLQTPLRPARFRTFLAGFVFALLALWLLSHAGPARIGSWFRQTFSVMRMGMDQSTVVQRIQRLQRLESVKFTAEKIVTGERPGHILPDLLTGDRLLLVVHGEVIAGVDLGKLKPDDVQVKGNRVRIALPAPEIFLTRIDNEKTRVYSRETGLLVQADPNLESEVRAEAERELQEAARADGILDTAAANARGTVNGLLQGLGFTDVQVQ